jgi:hypothetical protein
VCTAASTHNKNSDKILLARRQKQTHATIERGGKEVVVPVTHGTHRDGGELEGHVVANGDMRGYCVQAPQRRPR